MKKILAIILCLSMIIVSIPFSASAATSSIPYRVQWKFTDDTGKVITEAKRGDTITCKLFLPDYTAPLSEASIVDGKIAGVSASIAYPAHLFAPVGGGSIEFSNKTLTLAGGTAYVDKFSGATPGGTYSGPNLASLGMMYNGNPVVWKYAMMNYGEPAPARPLAPAADGSMLEFDLVVDEDAPLGSVAASNYRTFAANPQVDGVTLRGDTTFSIQLNSSINILLREGHTSAKSSYYGVVSFPELKILEAGGGTSGEAYDWDETKPEDRVSEQDPKIAYSSDAWSKVKNNRFTDKTAMKLVRKDESVTMSFKGTDFRILGYESISQGSFSVVVDGGTPETVYVNTGAIDPEYTDPGLPVYTSDALAAGDHTVVITSLENKPIQIDGFDIAATSGSLALNDAPAASAKRVSYEVPVADAAYVLGGSGATFENGFGLFSGGSSLIMMPGATLTITKSLPAGTIIKVGSYKSTTQGTFSVTAGSDDDIFDCEGTGRDTVANLYEFELTLTGAASSVVIESLTKGFQVDYITIIEP